MKFKILPSVRIGLVLLVISFASCTNKDDDSDTATELVSFEQQVIKRNLETTPSDINSFEVNLEFPELKNQDSSLTKTIIEQETQRGLNKSLFSDSIHDSYETVLNELQASYKKFKIDFPEVNTQWYLNRRVEVVQQSEASVTILTEQRSYLGGAHPSHLKTYRTYNKNTGGRLILAQLFSPEELELLRNAAEKEFRTQKGFDKDDDLAANGWYFPSGSFSLSSNFYLTDSSVVIHYNRYDIGSYAAGETTLAIDLNKIEQKES